MFDPEEFEREIRESIEEARKSCAKMSSEFEKARLDETSIIPEVGDTVVVNAGLLDMGHAWIRLEATVLIVGQSSYKVRFLDYLSLNGNVVEKWIHPALVTDVIRKEK